MIKRKVIHMQYPVNQFSEYSITSVNEPASPDAVRYYELNDFSFNKENKARWNNVELIDCFELVNQVYNPVQQSPDDYFIQILCALQQKNKRGIFNL
ncbi:hypothetical protein CIRMBP1197_00312 [Enterococcus cecorum]|nr:hypothetical protein CIRMBP1197_00312 [Enterococcus cecorum]CAI3408230.1 hypothetical protein CIRMBP1272_01586 [Enterococcus cecorum]CAI3493824.1 hypothetical protein CIRMBP1320_01933 [Enterococcus cecorum]